MFFSKLILAVGIVVCVAVAAAVVVGAAKLCLASSSGDGKPGRGVVLSYIEASLGQAAQCISFLGLQGSQGIGMWRRVPWLVLSIIHLRRVFGFFSGWKMVTIYEGNFGKRDAKGHKISYVRTSTYCVSMKSQGSAVSRRSGYHSSIWSSALVFNSIAPNWVRMCYKTCLGAV